MVDYLTTFTHKSKRMKVQEVIDKLIEYKDLAGNRKVSIRSDDDDSEHEITNIGWDPFQKQIKILIW